MALGKITLVQGLALVMVTLLWAGTMAQSDCTSVLITMAPCVDYVTGTSSTPSVPCCSQLANVVQLQPHCLCMALSGGGSSLGVEVNQTLALALPQLCRVKTPPESSCKAADGPAVVSISPSGSSQGLPPHSNDTPGSNSSTSVKNMGIAKGEQAGALINGDAPKILRRRKICVAIQFGDVSGDASTCVTTGYVFLGSAMQKLTGGSKTIAATASDVIFNISLQFILFLLPIALFSSTWTTIS
ncbi:non-specific lipid-transfer protein-like protein [Gossypium australe]|uniref:Non-specific lipid-transfer protein-like protein n=1 Tax=Gossypium australe TaxID=47621 RepID=A0A5B6WX11_9ROSI|nr:non-specific lipid-transfer protein-like protein [Gossypium australe]